MISRSTPNNLPEADIWGKQKNYGFFEDLAGMVY